MLVSAMGRKRTYHRPMTSAAQKPDQQSEQFRVDLERSSSLGAMIEEVWHCLEDGGEPKVRVPAGLCRISLDHARAIRLLLPLSPPSAVALLRPQYETLVRAVWARHAARPGDIDRLLAPLTLESQQAARKLPGVPDMLAAIEKTGPRGAGALLARAKDRLWDGLNSFIHGGIHPFRRGHEGYPLALLTDLLKNANAFSVLTLLVLAELTDDPTVVELVGTLHGRFQDILPALEPFAES